MSAVSAFKTLFTQMIENGGDYDSLPKDILKKDFQVFVKETRPYFLVSDSFFYVPAYFTQAALNDYNSKFPQVNVLDLEHRVIVITKWTLELRKVNSAEVFTSYAGVECRLIVHAFKPQLKEQLHPTRYPTNLYRDDEFKTTIQALRHKQVTEAAKPASMAALTAGKGQVSQGIVANSVSEWTFKEGNTKTATLGGGKKKEAQAAGAKAPKVKGGAKTKVAKKGKAGKTGVVDSVMKATKTPTAGKASRVGKKSLGKAKATPDEAGKRTKPASSNVMTVEQYRKFLSTLKKGKKGAKK